MMGEDELLGRFEHVQRIQGGRWCSVPHMGTGTRLSTSRGRKVGGSFHCHAGCEAEAVLGAAGLDWSDLSE